MKKIKPLLKLFIPPILYRVKKNFFKKQRGYLSGPYKNWAEALNYTQGYTNQRILERIVTSMRQVKDNANLFARDGVIFETFQHPYPVYAALLKIALQHRKLTVLDFGGALGASFFAFKRYLGNEDLSNLHWMIVEQPAFVAEGKKLFTQTNLSFHSDIHQLPYPPDIIILSATLQYLAEPYQILKDLLALSCPYWIVDRVWCSVQSTQDRLLIEHVPSHIYSASYPCWLFSYAKLKQALALEFIIADEFRGIEGEFFQDGYNIISCGFFLQRKPNELLHSI